MSEHSLLMTVDELALILRLNRDTAYKAVAEQQVPGIRRIGRNIRINRAAVMAWLDGQDEHAAPPRRLR